MLRVTDHRSAGHQAVCVVAPYLAVKQSYGRLDDSENALQPTAFAMLVCSVDTFIALDHTNLHNWRASWTNR